MRYSKYWPTAAKRWDAMVVKETRVKEFTSDARFAIDHKLTYQAVEERTGAPWPLIAVLHRRESNANFTTYLGNGDPLNRVTTHDPAGRGPFSNFITGAVDALAYDHLSDVPDWRLEKVLYYMNLFNGFGFDPSSYMYGGTNIQVIGRWITDHHFDPNVWDQQPGAAPLLRRIMELDTTVTFQRED